MTQPNNTATAEGQASTETNTTTVETSDLTPEQLKKELEKVRREAAAARTKNNELEAKLSAAKTPEEVEAVRKELSEQNAKLARELLVATLTRDLPAEMVALVSEFQGDDKALTKFVEGMKQYVPKGASASTSPAPAKLSGGLDGDTGAADEDDPAKLAAQFRAGRI